MRLACVLRYVQLSASCPTSPSALLPRISPMPHPSGRHRIQVSISPGAPVRHVAFDLRFGCESKQLTGSSQVTDYLIKRGYNRTELVFRDESKNIGPDGRPIIDESVAMGPKKFVRAFTLLRDWVENNLDIYKVCGLTRVVLGF